MPKGFQKGHKPYGKAAGRPDNATLERLAMKKQYEDYLLKRILAEKEGITDGLIREARKGNVPAVKEAHERLIGKVPDAVDVTSGGETISILVSKSLAKAYNVNGTNTKAGNNNTGQNKV